MSILPSDTPRLPKWPFLVGDALLLGTAVLLATRSVQPYSNGVIIAIAICVALGCVLGAIPFLADYAQRQDEALDERQRGLEALTRTVADSAEQISVAANTMHELTELARQQVSQAESLPDTLGDSISEINQQIADNIHKISDTLRQEVKALKPSEPRKPDNTAEKLQQVLARLDDLEAALDQKLAALSAPVAAPAIVAAVEPAKSAEPEPTPPAEPVVAHPAEEPAEKPTPISAPETKTEASEALPATVEGITIEPAPELPAPKPAKKPAPKKPKADDGDWLALDDAPPAEVAAPPPASSKVAASDGATRLLVTAYIGIGNRLFIRGDGPGLNQEKGVPLQFVSIGKWQWETKDATGPVHVKLFKNDEIECTALGEITLESGHQAEVSASF